MELRRVMYIAAEPQGSEASQLSIPGKFADSFSDARNHSHRRIEVARLRSIDEISQPACIASSYLPTHSRPIYSSLSARSGNIA